MNLGSIAPAAVRRWALRYGAAVVAVFMGFGVRLALDSVEGGSLPTYITFYPPVMLTALLAGFGPGVLATAVTLAVTILWILEPVGKFAVSAPADRLGLVLFSAMGLLMSVVAELYRRSRRRVADFEQKLKLRESQERLRLALEAAKAGSWVWDMVSDTLEWSPELFRLFGLDPSAATASFDSWRSVILPEDRPVAQARLEQAIQRHERLASEYRIVLPAGEVRWISALGDTTYDPRGVPMRISGICLDITERNRAEEALLEAAVQRQSAEYARNLIEVSIDPMVTISPEGKITDVNEATIKATGMPRDKLIGADFSSYFTEPEKAQEGYRQVFAEGLVMDYPLTIRHRDGRLMDVLYNASVYKDSHGKVLGVFAAARDVTAQKQSEAERKRYQQRLRELGERLASTEERERRRISTQIHDTVIQTLSLCHIKMGAHRKELAEAGLAIPAEEVNTIRAMIEEAIVESRSLMAELTPPLLYELGLVAALQDLTDRLQKLHGVSIRLRDDGRPKPVEKTVQGFLFQAIRELMLNALKHAGPCSVTVDLTQENDVLRIRVEDDGAGFEVPEDRRFVFHQHGGFGLFTIADRLENAGGCFEIESRPGGGTRVQLSVPITPTAPEG